MSVHRGGVAASLAGVCALLLAGCGDNGWAAGNTPTRVRETSYVMVEPATTTTTVPAAATTVPPGGAIDPNEQIYVIQPNDSISKIASNHGISIDQLIQYNQWPNGINHVLIPGVEIKIPPNAKVPGTGTTPPASGAEAGGVPPVTEPLGEPCEHTIEAGDNPTRVAKKYGISVTVLQQANAGNSAYNSFPIGATLYIPANAEGC